MDKPVIQEKPINNFSLLPKPQQLATLQRYRDLRNDSDFFFGEVLKNDLSKELMDAIYTGRP